MLHRQLVFVTISLNNRVQKYANKLEYKKKIAISQKTSTFAKKLNS